MSTDAATTSSTLDALHQLAVSASEVHAASQRAKVDPNTKLRVEMKSEEDRTRKRQMRLLKNRQSAALSRQRKKEYISDLEVKAGSLNTDKSDLEYKVNKLTSLTLEYKIQVDKLEKHLSDVTQENAELKSKLAMYTSMEQRNNTSSCTPSASFSSSSSSSSAFASYPTPPLVNDNNKP